MTAATQPARPRPMDGEPDWVEVEQLIAGRRAAPDAHPSSVRAAARKLTRDGHGADRIADRIGTTARNVVRYRARDREQGITE